MDWRFADDDIKHQDATRLENGKAGLKKIVVSECIGPYFWGVTEHVTEYRVYRVQGTGEFGNVAMI